MRQQRFPALGRNTVHPLALSGPAAQPAEAPIPIICPRCSGVLRVTLEALGRGEALACPSCHGAFPLAPHALRVRPDQAGRMAERARPHARLSEFPPN